MNKAIYRFTEQDQVEFAKLSRDVNPVHLDQIAARRTLFGQPIVHGMHLVLRALDYVSANGGAAYSNLKVRFHRPVFLNEDVLLQVNELTDALEVSYTGEGTQFAVIQLSKPARFEDADWMPREDSGRTSPRVLEIEDMRDLAGEVQLAQTPEAIRALFPAAAASYGANRIANLLGVTYVIGMEVPGMHSMFATFTAALSEGVDPVLTYSVKKVTPKLSHVMLDLRSAVLQATAETFVRPRVPAIGFEACRHSVSPGEFSGRTALIVGGSRGLGRLTANLLAAGGGNVVITYLNGREEADKTVQEITENGASARAIRLDATKPEEGFSALAQSGLSITDLYYFATPHIFVRKKKLFEDNLLSSFLKSYTSDFLAVVEMAKSLSEGKLDIFYPSSDALNNPVKDLAEYHVAKTAGEAVCEMLNRYDEEVNVTVERLPRLPTDQTASLMQVATRDPIEVMLDICRRLPAAVGANKKSEV